MITDWEVFSDTIQGETNFGAFLKAYCYYNGSFNYAPQKKSTKAFCLSVHSVALMSGAQLQTTLNFTFR